MDYCLIALSSAYAAIAAQKLLRAEGVPFQVMPVPREVSASCGIALRFGPDRLEAARLALKNSALERRLYTFYGVPERGRPPVALEV